MSLLGAKYRRHTNSQRAVTYVSQTFLCVRCHMLNINSHRPDLYLYFSGIGIITLCGEECARSCKAINWYQLNLRTCIPLYCAIWFSDRRQILPLAMKTVTCYFFGQKLWYIWTNNSVVIQTRTQKFYLTLYRMLSNIPISCNWHLRIKRLESPSVWNRICYCKSHVNKLLCWLPSLM